MILICSFWRTERLRERIRDVAEKYELADSRDG